MGDGFFDRNLERLIGAARDPAGEATPQFRESLRKKLQDEAARLREPARDETGDPPARRAAWRPRQWGIAAAAAVLVAVAGLGIRWLVEDAAQGNTRIVAEVERPRALEPRRVSADRAVVIEVSRGATGSVTLVRGDLEIARLDLKDGAEVRLSPGAEPLLSLRDGVVRVEAFRGARLAAGHVEMAVDAGADVEVEMIGKGDRSMNKSWLVPGGIGASAGAALVAILVHGGNVEVTAPETRPALVPVAQTLKFEVPTTRPAGEDDRDKSLVQANRKIAELEKKLAASKKETEKLASDLVQKKGVTLDSIAARLADLRKGTGMNVFLPGNTAELIADLKGLGAAGTQALVDLLKSDDPKDRFIAAKLLEDLKDPAAIPALRDVALNDADNMAANMAGHALALMGDPTTVDSLREILAKKRSWESEVNSLWGLVNLGDAQGLEQAIAYMNNSAVSGQARAALGANIALFMHGPEVMPIVDQTVADFHQSSQVMGIAIEYYATLGTPAARERLQAIANDTRVNQKIRDQANQALQN